MMLDRVKEFEPFKRILAVKNVRPPVVMYTG